MGGIGNTGQTGELKPTAAQLVGGGSSATPAWTAPEAAPAALADTPATLRPYEETAPSTGLLAAGAAPTTGPTTGTLAPTAPIGTGFDHVPYPTHPDPVPGAPAPAPTPAPVPAAPAEVPMRQIWQPSGNMTAGQWIAANPNWETDFNRAEQRADGTWWVPQDPNAPRPAGPQYYQGTGNVIYGGSPPAGQLR